MNKKQKILTVVGPDCVHRPWHISLSDGERFLPPDPDSWHSYIGNIRPNPRDCVRREGAVVHAWRNLRGIVLPAAKRPNGSKSEMRSTPRLSLRGVLRKRAFCFDSSSSLDA